MDVIFFVVISVVQILPFSAASIELDRTDLPKVFTRFKGSHEIAVGTPVFSNGRLVGSVAAVKSLTEGSKQWGDYEVELAVTPLTDKNLAEGTVALLSSPLVSPKRQPRAVVELVAPFEQKNKRPKDVSSSAQVASQKRIKGFSSYEEFWRADS